MCTRLLTLSPSQSSPALSSASCVFPFPSLPFPFPSPPLFLFLPLIPPFLHSPSRAFPLSLFVPRPREHQTNATHPRLFSRNGHRDPQPEAGLGRIGLHPQWHLLRQQDPGLRRHQLHHRPTRLALFPLQRGCLGPSPHRLAKEEPCSGAGTGCLWQDPEWNQYVLNPNSPYPDLPCPALPCLALPCPASTPKKEPDSTNTDTILFLSFCLFACYLSVLTFYQSSVSLLPRIC